MIAITVDIVDLRSATREDEMMKERWEGEERKKSDEDDMAMTIDKKRRGRWEEGKGKEGRTSMSLTLLKASLRYC